LLVPEGSAAFCTALCERLRNPKEDKLYYLWTYDDTCIELVSLSAEVGSCPYTETRCCEGTEELIVSVHLFLMIEFAGLSGLHYASVAILRESGQVPLLYRGLGGLQRRERERELLIEPRSVSLLSELSWCLSMCKRGMYYII
jgi:hypothetical protein